MVRGLIQLAGPDASRPELAEFVCEAFGFFDARGKPRLASCSQALRRLDLAGRIRLPPPGTKSRTAPEPDRTRLPVRAPEGIPARVALVSGLTVTLVSNASQRECWRSLMAAEHPLGDAGHAGIQLRYLVYSEHGVLGAFGFSPSALDVDARDRYIGWDTEARVQRLHRMSRLRRLLIRVSDSCADLASEALLICLRRLPGDSLMRYGFHPLVVESYTDADSQDEAALEAAGFRRVGETRARGRFGPAGRKNGLKAVWLFSLDPDWQQLLTLPPSPPPVNPLDPGEGLGDASWAHNEFGGAQLGDVRLVRRLVRSASLQAARPGESFPSLVQGKLSELRGHYRLLDQPDVSPVTPAAILWSHVERTLTRMQGQSTVLCLQGGTDFDFANRRQCVGLGRTPRSRDPNGAPGLHMHSTLTLSEDGLPLGLLGVEYGPPAGDAPIEGREADRAPEPPHERLLVQPWIRGLQDCARAAQRLVDVQVVAVLDRQGSVLRLLRAWSGLAGWIGLLLRVRQDGSLDGESLFAAVRSSSVRAELTIDVPWQAASRAGRPARAARRAVSELRWTEVELPCSSKGEGWENRCLRLLHVREKEDPADGPRLEWFLLSSETVQCAKDALKILNWYGQRQRISDWHKVLVSGCRASKVLHRRRRRMERAITIKAVIAWRLMLLALLGMETPDLSAQAVFDDAELEVLRDFARHSGLPEPAAFADAMPAMAALGTWRCRKDPSTAGGRLLWEALSGLAAAKGRPPVAELHGARRAS